MKHSLSILAILAVALTFSACKSDSTGGDSNSDPIVGVWKSEGAGNVAPGLASLSKTRKIDATFNKNGTYVVVSTDSTNATVTFSGTWAASAETPTQPIRTITLNQTVPSSVVASGIFKVEGTLLTYEVLQTSPAIPGFAAPTIAGGFGSTSYNNFPLGATWIQKFTKQ
jgi:hypothetical protein